MAARRRHPEYAGTYVDGNTVRKVNRTTPQTKPERRVQDDYKRSHVVRRNRDKALYMDRSVCVCSDHSSSHYAVFMYELPAYTSFDYIKNQ